MTYRFLYRLVWNTDFAELLALCNPQKYYDIILFECSYT